MRKVTLSNAPKVPFNLEGYIMHASSSLEVIHLCLHPGQEIAQHTNPFDVVACLLSGEVTLIYEENKEILHVFEVVEIEASSQRGFINHGAHDARLLILKKL